MNLTIKIGAGEIADRVTILDVKQEKLGDPAKQSLARAEYYAITNHPDYRSLSFGTTFFDLWDVNNELWDVLAEQRSLHKSEGDGNRFMELSGKVIVLNDRRAMLKREIDHKNGTHESEQKSFL